MLNLEGQYLDYMASDKAILYLQVIHQSKQSQDTVQKLTQLAFTSSK
jgi:hypothetical protein